MVLLTIIMLGCAATGVVFLIAFFTIAKYRHQQKSWPKTNGRIIGHRILKKWYHLRLVNGKRFCVVLKEYEYEVLGINYIHREELEPSLEDVAKFELIQTPLASTVEVYYNPQNPGEATIKPGIRLWDVHYLLTGLLGVMLAGRMFNVLYL
ncbi:MAG: DUF3592 domain-containing protein [Anaerolineales bacterium]|nr:DUF3592 domain-containing protein [Anaerolineales bacterium]